MTPSPEGLPTKAKEAPSPHEVRLAPLDNNPIFQGLRANLQSKIKDANKRDKYSSKLVPKSQNAATDAF